MAPGLQPIAGIRPSAPEVSLLTSGATSFPPGTDWRTGVSWRGAACGYEPSGWPRCPDDDTPDKPAPGDIAEPAFRPYTFLIPFACDWVVPGTEGDGGDGLGYDEDARAQLEAVTAYVVSREVWAGTIDALDADAANPTLQSEATDVTGGAEGLDVNFAVSSLLESYAECAFTLGGAVLHVPTILAPSLLKNVLAAQAGRALRGPLGVAVSPGPGYPPDGAPDGALIEAGPAEVWVYISGPVEVAVGDTLLLPGGTEGHWDRRMNRYQIWAERKAIHRFDPCCVFAALVRVPTAPDLT